MRQGYLSLYTSVEMSPIYGGTLKMVDKFTNVGSNVSLTENDINIRLAKAWTAIDRLSFIMETRPVR